MKAPSSKGKWSSVVDLSVGLGPLSLRHPLVNASGTMELLELKGVLGSEVTAEAPVAAFVAKTVTLSPRAGNPPPRVVETSGGMLNAVGLPSLGIEAFIEEGFL